MVALWLYGSSVAIAIGLLTVMGKKIENDQFEKCVTIFLPITVSNPIAIATVYSFPVDWYTRTQTEYTEYGGEHTLTMAVFSCITSFTTCIATVAALASCITRSVVGVVLAICREPK